MSRVSPPELERSTRRVVALGFAAGAAGCAAATVLPAPWDAALFLAAMLAFMAVTGWHAALWLRSRAYVHDHGLLICRDCGYPVGGLAGEGACPECGTAYRHDALRRFWSDRLEPLAPDADAPE